MMAVERENTNTTEDLLATLLDRLGLSTHVENTNIKSARENKSPTVNPVAYFTLPSPPYSPIQAHYVSSMHHLTPPPGFGYSTAHVVNPHTIPSPTIIQPAVPVGYTVAQQAQPESISNNLWMVEPKPLPEQETLLPLAFTAGTLHDPTTGVWNMDTGASSHLNASVNSLSNVFNTCMYPSVSFGDGHSIPVTNNK